MAIRQRFWIDHLQGTTEALNNTMVTVVDTFADIPTGEIDVYVNEGTAGERADQIRTSGQVFIVLDTGDTYLLNEDGSLELIKQHPRYVSPSNTATYNASAKATTNKAITTRIDKNLESPGHAWIPIVTSGALRSSGEVAHFFNVVNSTAISCPISGNAGNDTVKLMVSVSASPDFDIIESETFETNNYTPIYTLSADSGSNITNRRSLFGSSTNLARYFNQATKNNQYLHFAWYLEKTTVPGDLRFGNTSTLAPTNLTKDNTLTNAFSSATLLEMRTKLGIGFTSNQTPAANRRYSLIVAEPGHTFSSGSPNSNADHLTFNGSDVTVNTNVSSPLASRWEIDVANVDSDLNLSYVGSPSVWNDGEIRSGLASTATERGVAVDGVELEIRSSGLMTGSVFE